MKYIYTLLLSVLVAQAFSQADILDNLMAEQKPKKEYVAYTFKTTRIINGESVEMVKKNALDFRVSHRFGDAFATSNNNIHNLFGFDQASDILLAFEYGATDDLTVGIGRTKGAGLLGELWNANLKYRVLKQTKDFKIPLTITLFGNTVISSMKSSNDPTTLNDFPKGYTGFSHRLSYLLQGLIAVKATDWLSIQLSPTFLWRNVVPIGDHNATGYLGFSARAKFNKRMGIVFEYYLPLAKDGDAGRYQAAMIRGKKNAGYYPNLNVGLEFETGGHVFHVNFSNTAGLIENDYLPYNGHNWAQGQFRLGFTISRTFQLDKKGGKYWKKGSVEDPEPAQTEGSGEKKKKKK